MIKIGYKYGLLTVIERGKTYINPKTHRKKVRWKCKCECGAIVEVKQDHLISGHTKSCGHLSKEALQKANEERRRPDGELSNDELRHRSSYKDFKKRIRARDGYECFMCGTHKFLDVHHLYSFQDHEALRENDSNGITLCQSCHRDFHMWHGGFHVTCTTLQFIEWALKNGIDPQYLAVTWIDRNLLF